MTLPPKHKGRPLPGNMASSCRERGSIEWRWTKGFVGKEVPKGKEKEIRCLDDDAVIRLARHGLDLAVKESPSDEKWRGFIDRIIRSLKDTDTWPAFAKACREEHRRWLFWCMEHLDDGDGNSDGEE